METQDNNPINSSEERRSLRDERRSVREFRGNMPGRIFGGLIVITVGVLLLARQMGVDFPFWLISWKVLLIAIGLFLGVKHSFRGPAWLILILVGGVFLLSDIDPTLQIHRYVAPIIIITVGLMMIIRPRKKNAEFWRSWEQKMNSYEPNSQDDFIDSTTFFGGVKKKIISKNFRGGDVTTVFGGTEVNLTQADTNGAIVLELTQIFGGTKLVVPPHWKVQSEDLVCIFGGLEDKRITEPGTESDPNKVLILKGTCIFGGIDIKSF